LGLRRIAGTGYEAGDLAKKLLRNSEYLGTYGGGYTISGGEPAAQPDFLLELLTLLRGNHRAVETSGFCSKEFFILMADESELLLMDLKLIDGKEHYCWTNADNSVILENLHYLTHSGKAFIVRIPVIPGVNDTIYNEAADLLAGSTGLLRVELLPYHKTAGSKYSMLGLRYEPGFDSAAEPLLDITPFTDRNIPCVVL
jgi:pyruvate formate lyase activating enzyme